MRVCNVAGPDVGGGPLAAGVLAVMGAVGAAQKRDGSPETPDREGAGDPARVLVPGRGRR